MKLYTQIFKLAIPAILTNLSVPLLSFVDTIIVGHLGSTSFMTAITLGSVIFNTLFWLFGFLRMSTSGFVAQACGKKKHAQTHLLLWQSLSLAIIISIGLLLCQSLMLYIASFFMQASEITWQLTRIYFQIVIWGAPAILMLYAFNGWFIGNQNTRIPLYLSLFQNGCNIGLSLYFVYVLKLQLRGVALGTTIAQYLSLGLAFYFYCQFKKNTNLKLLFSPKLIFNTTFAKSLARINTQLFLRTLCIILVTFSFTSLGSFQGEVVVAANALLLQFFFIFSYFMDGLAYAGESLSGFLYGQKAYLTLQKMVSKLIIIGLLFAFCFTVIYFFGGTAILSLFTNQAKVLAHAISYLPWIYGLPFVAFLAFLFDGIFIGLTQGKYLLITMLFATILFFVSYLFVEKYLHNHGLWLAFLVYLFTRGLVAYYLYKKLSPAFAQ